LVLNISTIHKEVKFCKQTVKNQHFKEFITFLKGTIKININIKGEKIMKVLREKATGVLVCVFVFVFTIMANLIGAYAAPFIHDTFDSGNYANNNYYSMSNLGNIGVENGKLTVIGGNNLMSITSPVKKLSSGISSGTFIYEFDYKANKKYTTSNAGSAFVKFRNDADGGVVVSAKSNLASDFLIGTGTTFGAGTAVGASNQIILPVNTDLHFKFTVNITAGTVGVICNGVEYTTVTGLTISSPITSVVLGAYGYSTDTFTFDNTKLYMEGSEAEPIFNSTFESGTLFDWGWSAMNASSVYDNKLVLFGTLNTTGSNHAYERRFEPVSSGKLVWEFDYRAYSTDTGDVLTNPYGLVNSEVFSFYNGISTTATNKLIGIYSAGNRQQDVKFSTTTQTAIGTGGTAGYWTNWNASNSTIRLVLDRDANTLDMYRKVGGAFEKMNNTPATVPAGNIDRVRFNHYGSSERIEISNVKIYTLGATAVPQATIVNADGTSISTLTANSMVKAAVPVSANGDLTVILALFDSSNKLIGMSSTQASVLDDYDLIETKYTLPNNVNGCYIKAFVWDSIDGMIPYNSLKRYPTE
jgi:hypothetical protein